MKKKNSHKMKVDFHGLKKLFLFKKMFLLIKGGEGHLSHQKTLLTVRAHLVLVNLDLLKKNNSIILHIKRKKKNMKIRRLPKNKNL